MPADKRPMIVHVVYRFDTGGLENGVVNLVNRMPADAYRHTIVALTEITGFRDRVTRGDVDFVALNKPPGQGIWQFPKLYRLFRKLRPAIVHSRNLSALEVQAPAWAAGVPVRIHSEHGRALEDADGKGSVYQRVRRIYRPFVQHYIALSRDLAEYLSNNVGVPGAHVTQIYNGVDTDQFKPPTGQREQIADCPFDPNRHWLVGTVGRMQTVKDQTMLAQAFIHALELAPRLKTSMRLVMVGDGPLRAQAQAMLDAAGATDLAWLPGERRDVAAVMRGLHVFALPSLAEGISNTVLEAMASGLPVVATAVGGNADLVLRGLTGEIVAAGDPLAMAHRLVQLANDRQHAREMGDAGRRRVEVNFSLESMINNYKYVYDTQLARASGR